MQAPVALAPLLRGEVGLALARVAVHRMRHQRVGGVERALDGRVTVALLALGHVAFGEVEVGEDAVGVRPLLEQVVVLEEVVVPEGRVGDDERLHHRRVLLHDVGDARVRVDDDLVGEAAQALAVARLVLGELLAEAPVLVEERHADARIGVEHLLRRDDLDLVPVGVELELAVRDIGDRVVDSADHGEVPVAALEEQRWRGERRGGHAGSFLAPTALRSKRRRNTG